MSKASRPGPWGQLDDRTRLSHEAGHNLADFLDVNPSLPIIDAAQEYAKGLIKAEHPDGPDPDCDCDCPTDELTAAATAMLKVAAWFVDAPPFPGAEAPATVAASLRFLLHLEGAGLITRDWGGLTAAGQAEAHHILHGDG